MTGRVWIRADGSPEIGLGHVMRSVAIAEGCQQRFVAPRFVVGGSTDTVRLVQARGFDATFAPGPDDRAWLADVCRDDAVVFDGYRFDAELMEDARARAGRTAAVVDDNRGEYPVHVLLNQNPVSTPDYRLPAQAITLLGPRYALVRDEFRRHRRYRGDDSPQTLLVTAGGSDVAGVSRQIIDGSRDRPAFDRLVVVVGPAAGIDRRTVPADVEVVVAPSDVAATFARGDAAISAAGSTTWELLAMGIPTALVQVADNQAPVGPGVSSGGAALFVGSPPTLAANLHETLHRLADRDIRRSLSRAALDLVDGHGVARFLSALLD